MAQFVKVITASGALARVQRPGYALFTRLDNASLMRLVDRFLLQLLLPRLVAKACPSTVHRSGEEGKRVNCFNTVMPEGIRPRTVIVGITGSTVQGLEFDGQSHKRPVTLELCDIDAGRLEVTHYYGLDTVRFGGVYRLAFAQITKWPYVLLHALRAKEGLLQRWFNFREMKLGDRLTILKDVADLDSEGVQDIGALDIMSHRYGNRWAGHPGWRALQERLDRQLQLLAQAGDLSTSDSFSFRLTGQGVRTLDERRDAAKKHGANWWMQFALWTVAVIAAGFTAAQTGFVKLPSVIDWQTDKADKVDKAASSPGSQPTVAAPPRASVVLEASSPDSASRLSTIATSGAKATSSPASR